MFSTIYSNACSKILKLTLCNATLAGLVSEILPIVLSFAGIYMLANIVIGGITLMTGSGDQAAVKKGYGMVQNGIIGFFIVAVSYVVVRLLSTILGVSTI